MEDQTELLDPVCGKPINLDEAFVVINFNERDYALCCPICRERFEEDPEMYSSLADMDLLGSGLAELWL